MAKPGRPRALTLNEFVVNGALGRKGMTKAALCAQVSISPPHLSEALGVKRKGVNEDIVREMALALGVAPEEIAPELTGRFLGLRATDPEAVGI